MTEPSPDQPKLGKVTPALLQGWLVEDIEGRGVIDRARTTIRFNQDGTVNGNTEVKLYNATPAITEDTITIGDFPVTRRSGPPALMDQESKFLAAIQKVKRYNVGEIQVPHLLDKNGKELMRTPAIK